MEFKLVSKYAPAGDQPKAIAYIDGANLHQGTCTSGWFLDYRRFRSWIRQKFLIDLAYIFIGKIKKHRALYRCLTESGYVLMFKDVIVDRFGKTKGNCDADLVLRSVRDYFECDIRSVILVSSDGDYAPLIHFWKEKDVKCSIISPAPVQKCSLLLRRTNVPIVYLHDVRQKLSRPPK
jgi:uncharacterized LabA/DUF88 family protein